MIKPIRYCYLMAILIMAGCGLNNKSHAPKLSVDLYVRYLADNAEFMAQATFKEGDTIETARPKTMPGGVAFQHSGMEERDMSGLVRYEVKRRGPFNPPFTFSFNNEKGEKDNIEVVVNPIDSFYVKGEAVKTKGLTIGLKASSISPEETLIALFSDQAGQSASLNFAGPFESGELFIPGSTLAALQPGKLQVYLVRTSTKTEDGPRRNLVAVGEYYTATIETTLVN